MAFSRSVRHAGRGLAALVLVLGLSAGPLVGRLGSRHVGGDVRSSLERIQVEAERQAARADDRSGSLQRHRLKLELNAKSVGPLLE